METKTLNCSKCKSPVELGANIIIPPNIIEALEERLVCSSCAKGEPMVEKHEAAFKTVPIDPAWLLNEDPMIEAWDEVRKDGDLQGATNIVLIGNQESQVKTCQYVAAAHKGPGNIILADHLDLSDRLNALHGYDQDLIEFESHLIAAELLVIANFGKGRMGETGDPQSVTSLRILLEKRAMDEDSITVLGCSLPLGGLRERANTDGNMLLDNIKQWARLKI